MTEPEATTSAPERRPIRARSTGWARAVTRLLIRCRATPNSISVAGMAAALLAGVALWATAHRPDDATLLFVAAAVLIQVRLLCNLFDGMVAVATSRTSAVGDLYNEIPDRVSDAAVLIGLGYAHGGQVELGYVAACIALFVALRRQVLVDGCGILSQHIRQQHDHVVEFAARFASLDDRH